MAHRLKERTSFSIDPDIVEQLRDLAFNSKPRQSMSSLVERGIERVIKGEKAANADDPALHQVRLKYFHRVPCGPMREAVEEGSDFVVSEDVADALEVLPSDFVVMAEGESMMGSAMEGRDIVDGDYLLMRPVAEGRTPKSGEIVAAVIVSEGSAQSTVKFWNNGSPPYLTDGQGERVELPEDTERLVAVGVLRGLIRKY